MVDRRRRLGAVLAALLAVGPAGAARPQAEADVRAGIRALGAGKPRAAIEAAARAVRQDAGYAPAWLLQAEAAIAIGDGVPAEAAVGRARQAGAPAARTAAVLGEAVLLQGDAIRAYHELQRAGDGDARAWRLRGRALQMMDRNDEAAAAFDRALRIAPDDAMAWVDFGRFLLALGDLRGAIGASDKAAALGPRSPEALLLRGELARAQYGLRAALPWFDRGLAIDPEHVPTLLARAATLGDMGATRAMLADTRAVLALLPGNPRAFYLQAVLAARARKFAVARSLIERTGGRLDDEWAVMLLRGAIEYESGNDEQAIDWLRRLVEAMPGNIKARRLLGAALLRKGDAAEAADVLSPLAGAWIEDSYALLLLARARERLGDGRATALLRAQAARPGVGKGFGPPIPDDELQIKRRTAALSPRNADARIELIEGLIRNGLFGEAVMQASDLRRIYPGAPQAHLLVGDALIAAGQPAAAAQSYAQAANIAFTEATALRLIDAWRRAGNEAAARRVVDLYLGQNPQSAPVQLIRANLLMGARAWSDAADELEALRLRLGDRDALLLNNLGWSLMEAGEERDGLVMARLAYRLMPANPAVAQSWGWMLVRSNHDAARGVAILERSALIAPRSPTVRWHLAQAYAQTGQRDAARAELAATLALPGFADRAAAWRLLRSLS